MAIPVNDNIQNSSPKSLDNKYGIFASGAFRAYTSISEANSSIGSGLRYLGLTVLINTGSANVEYWYLAGITDGDLVIKIPTIGATSPITFTSNTIAIPTATTSQNGYLTSSDWNIFNLKVTTAANVGSGAGLFLNKTGTTLNFKSIIAGSNITITENSNDITIASTGSGSSTGANLGSTGARIYSSNSGSTLQFRRLIVGSGLSATENTNDITITLPDLTLPNSLTTSDASINVLSSVTIPNSSAGYIEVGISGILTSDASKSIVGKKYLKFSKIAGVLTSIGSTGDIIDTGTVGLTTADWDIVTNSSTNNIDIEVTGEAATNIKWLATIIKFINNLP